MKYMNTQKLRYPIGEFMIPQKYNSGQLKEHITSIRDLPGQLMAAISGLSEGQLDTSYRDDGWTLRQVIHHVADSHINAYCRFKLAVTEDEPSILPYDQNKWAESTDSLTLHVDVSLRLLTALHERWYNSMIQLNEQDWERRFYHPEHDNTFTLYQLAANYAWHGEHHCRHITDLRGRMNWR
jgi:hypothetical protein